MDRIPTWLAAAGNQLSDETLAELHEAKRPITFLGELPDGKVPGYLYPLVMAARMLNGLAVYNEPVADKARALRIIEQARRELLHAEQRCQK